MNTTAPEVEVLQIVRAEHHDPFHILGAHPVEIGGGAAVAVRAFLPHAASVEVLTDFDEPAAMSRIHPEGFFEAVFMNRDRLFPYRLRLSGYEGHSWTIIDPYSFWPILTDFDIHLLAEGSHLRAYDKLGAHIMDVGDVRGVLFAVWAPNASRVSVIGDFNSWDGRRHPMRSRPPSGMWELFIPGLESGEKYKYEVRSRAGDYVVQKADPFAFYSELRPRTASIVHDLSQYAWGDSEWLERRAEHNGFDKPISAYEVHLGSWKRHTDESNSWLNYRELAHELVDYVQDMGFTHVELLPVSEHPLDASWGYQTTGYYSVTSRYGAPQDFQYFVDYCHRNGIGVILDWVPAHFPMDEHGLRFFDGTYLYEHEDPRLGRHQDWGTSIFNYGRTEVRNFLIANALFWFDKYHVDGLRVDAVASMLYLDYSRKHGEWIPNRYGGRENLEAISFIRDLNTLVHGQYPNVLTIAEESTAWPSVTHPVHLGGLGFSLKWNMGWMHDTLVYFSKDPIYRKYHHNSLTFAVWYAFSENFVLVFSHDEVVHMKGSMIGKMPGDEWQKFANLRALYSFMFAFPGKKLLFMGNEFGQWAEWSNDRSLDWYLLRYEPHQRLQKCVRDLNRLYRELPQFHSTDFQHWGFRWIDFADSDQSVISFERRGQDPEDTIMVVGNFTPVPRPDYRIGLDRCGTYDVIFNSDSGYYGGSNYGNWGVVSAREGGFQGRPASVVLDLPPLAVMYLRRRSAVRF
ncbi:MAG: 1,4-alpha-glucan branching protein GlgB [Acidobacteria bacterium]|nr:1,4-alpha-glucan branching protein GlgB [Acidobacteriota bacterium]